MNPRLGCRHLCAVHTPSLHRVPGPRSPPCSQAQLLVAEAKSGDRPCQLRLLRAVAEEARIGRRQGILAVARARFARRRSATKRRLLAVGQGWPVRASTRRICKNFCRNQCLAQAATAGREALRLAKATRFRIPSSARKGSIDSYRKKPLDSRPSYSPMGPSFNPSPSRGPRIRLVYQVAGDRAGQANA